MSWAHDWPVQRREDGRTDSSGPDLPEWPEEDE